MSSENTIQRQGEVVWYGLNQFEPVWTGLSQSSQPKPVWASLNWF